MTSPHRAGNAEIFPFDDVIMNNITLKPRQNDKCYPVSELLAHTLQNNSIHVMDFSGDDRKLCIPFHSMEEVVCHMLRFGDTI